MLKSKSKYYTLVKGKTRLDDAVVIEIPTVFTVRDVVKNGRVVKQALLKNLVDCVAFSFDQAVKDIHGK